MSAVNDSVRPKLAVVAGTVFLLAGFGSLFTGTEWFFLIAAILAAMWLAATLVGLRWPRWEVPAALLTAVLAIGWAFVPETTRWGLLTVASFEKLVDLAKPAATVILEETAPISPPVSIQLVLVIAFALLFVLGISVVKQTWRIWLLGVLWLTVFVVPSAVSAKLGPWWVFVGLAGSWLWIWWQDRANAGPTSTRAGLAVALPALAVAAAVPLIAPELEPIGAESEVVQSGTFGVGINPILELGRNLRQPKSQEVLRYTTDAASGVYLKVSTLREFSGRTWRPSVIFQQNEIEGLEQLQPDIEVSLIVTDIEIGGLRATYLPVPYPATEIRGLAGEWTWLTDGATVRAEGTTTTLGQKYSVTSAEVLPSREQIQAAPPAGPDFDSYTGLPPGVPQIVIDRAQTHGGAAANDYDKMVALQNWLRDEFTYSTEAPVEGDYDGNGLDVMGEFLARQAGYCVHFASTLAVMGRVLGVPTRVAVGYAPGSVVSRDAQSGAVFGVNSDDLHAWTEAYFAGIGWVGFDATPGVGGPTNFASEEQSQDLEPEQAEPTAEQSSAPPAAEQDVLSQADQAAPSATRITLVLAIAMSLVVLAPALWRQLRRRRRLRAGITDPEELWLELCDTALDLGLGSVAAKTPRAFARQLLAAGADDQSLAVVVDRLERLRYSSGPADHGSDTEAAKTAIKSLESAAAKRQRIRAKLLPKSLLRAGANRND